MAKKKAAAQKAAAPVTVDDWGATAAAPSKKKKGGGGLMKMGGVVVAAVAVIMALGGGGANPLVDLDVNDEAALRKVFFGGEVWAVACQAVWKSNFGRPTPSTRRASVAASARWRGDSTPLTRRCPRGRVGSMAWRLTKST